jgi:hypothetical protein
MFNNGAFNCNTSMDLVFAGSTEIGQVLPPNHTVGLLDVLGLRQAIET